MKYLAVVLHQLDNLVECFAPKQLLRLATIFQWTVEQQLLTILLKPSQFVNSYSPASTCTVLVQNKSNHRAQTTAEVQTQSPDQKSTDPESRSRWLPKFNGDFLLQRYMSGKLFMNMSSVVPKIWDIMWKNAVSGNVEEFFKNIPGSRSRNMFWGTWYMPHSQVHNERTVPIIMARWIAHARNGNISTSTLKSDVTIMFLHPDFL